VLATIHRAENTDNSIRLLEIVFSLNEINKIIPVIVPLHPRTSKIFKDLEIEAQFKIIEPVGYLDMIQLISHSRLVLTDSGGLQKEAYFFNKYCITFRDETEWVELVENGYNEITGASSSRIINAFNSTLNNKFLKKNELYGGGNAAEIIFKEIINSNN
jgi:UDP-GlcNAc3NAcA epimerase